jgi:AraC-like DNA-binding protein
MRIGQGAKKNQLRREDPKLHCAMLIRTAIASPAPDLQGYVANYGLFFADATHECPTLMLPEGIIELVIHLDAHTRQRGLGESWQDRQEAFIGGLHQRAYQVHIRESGLLFSVKFHIAQFAVFYEGPIHALKNTMVAPDDLWGHDGARLVDQIRYAPSFDDQIRLMEHFLRKHAKVHPHLTVQAAARDLTSAGAPSIKDLAAKYRYSPSRFRHIFNEVVGISPRDFASVQRIRLALSLYPTHASFTDLGFALGYHDQAHFIRDWKKRTGFTPGDFFLSIQSGDQPFCR